MISYIIIYAIEVHLMSGQAMQWRRKQIESRGGARHQKSCQAKNKKDNGYGYV